MTAKEFLGQAWRIDRMVSAKLEQLLSLRELSTKATSTLSDVPPSSGTQNIHRMDDIVIKILELESEVRCDIEKLVNLKRDIIKLIKSVSNDEYRTLLELRYLCFKPWSEIATDMRYSKDHIFTLHRKSLDAINITVKSVEKQ